MEMYERTQQKIDFLTDAKSHGNQSSLCGVVQVKDLGCAFRGAPVTLFDCVTRHSSIAAFLFC